MLSPKTAWSVRALLLLTIAIFQTSIAHAQTPRPRADQPLERTDATSRLAHQQLVAKTRQGRIDVYFLGDSITRRWGATDYPDFLAHWKETFHGWNAANFGWGGDRTEHMLWRLDHGEFEGVSPKVIVLLAGTNNISRTPPEGHADDISSGIKAIIARLRAKAPKATIILMAIFPRTDIPTANPVIDEINAKIARFANGREIRFLNINSQLADERGVFRAGVGVDRLHLALKGYQIWGEALKPILTELLGPPAATDEAPPPTGDPAAAGRK
jgi:lysophospholipase L1-like esterase